MRRANHHLDPRAIHSANRSNPITFPRYPDADANTASGTRVHTVQADTETWHFGGVYEKTEYAADPDVEEEHRYWVFARGKRLLQVTRTRGPSGSSEVAEYFHYDRQGSVIAMTDAGGTTTGEFTYGIYGEPEQELPTPYGYTGHRHEQALGLVDMGGRFYDPKFGVFLSADPVSPFGGGSPRMNRYAYVGYDPVNFIDPSGRSLVPLFSSWIMHAAMVAALPPTFNYVVTGDFSYDWSKETWAAAATIGASVGAGLGCAAISGPAAGLAAGACAGLVGGGVGAALAGGGIHEIVVSSFAGLGLGFGGGAIGMAAASGAFLISSNPYVIAGTTVVASTGGNIGLQSLTGQDIDWTMVAAQAAVSTLLSFYEAAKQDLAMRQLGAEHGQAVGGAYSEASGAVQRRQPASSAAAGDDPWNRMFGPVDGSKAALHTPEPFDERTEAFLKGLHPAAQRRFRMFLDELRGLGMEFEVRSGFRTYAEQDQLFRTGVSDVGGGGSFHNFDRAIDVTILNPEAFGGSVAAYKNDFAFVARSSGFTWGGDWATPDLGHVQLDWGIQATGTKSFWSGRFLRGEDLFYP